MGTRSAQKNKPKSPWLTLVHASETEVGDPDATGDLIVAREHRRDDDAEY
jgi:hypothetical protein